MKKILDTGKDDFYRYENTSQLKLSELVDIHNKNKSKYEKLTKKTVGKHNFIPNERQWRALQYLSDDFLHADKIGLGGGMGCFDGDTEVLTDKGHVPIKDVKVGQKVLSYNKGTGKQVWNKVKDVFKYGGCVPVHKMVELQLYEKQTIRCTTNHKFLIKGNWVTAGDLAKRAMEESDGWELLHIKCGEGKAYESSKERLQTLRSHKEDVRSKGHRSGQELETSSIKAVRFYEQETVYDLSVENTKNYTVTKENYIVHNSSKTTLAMYWVISQCLKHNGVAYGIARKTITSIIKTTYPSFIEMSEILNIPKSLWKYNGKDNVITFKNGSKIYFIELAYKPDDPEYTRLRGYQLTGVVFEEANEMTELGIKSLLLRYGRWKNKELNIAKKALFTFNPSKGYVYNTFYKPWYDRNEDKKTRYIPSLAMSNPFLSQDYLETLWELGEKERQVFLLGNFEFAESIGQLLDYEHISRIWTNTVMDVEKRFMTVDVAGIKGKDNTVFTLWRGWEVIDVFVKKGLSPDQIIQEIRDYADKYEVPFKHIAIDSIGLGEGIANSSFLSGVYPFKSSHSPIATESAPTTNSKKMLLEDVYKTTSYNNLRTQCAFRLANKIRQGEFSMRVDNKKVVNVNGKDDILKEVIERELSVLIDKNAKDPELKRVLIKKDDMKKLLGGYSPDVLDTFIMRAVFDILEMYDDVTSSRKITPLFMRNFFKKKNPRGVTFV